MILIITPSVRHSEYARSVSALTGEPCQTAASSREALTRLKAASFSCVVLDSSYVETAPFGGDALMKHTGTAVTLFADFVLQGPDRVARLAHSALRRAHMERVRALKTAGEQFRAEFRTAVTGVLLSSELALRTPHLEERLSEKLREIRELARTMQKQLESPGELVGAM